MNIHSSKNSSQQGISITLDEKKKLYGRKIAQLKSIKSHHDETKKQLDAIKNIQEKSIEQLNARFEKFSSDVTDLASENCKWIDVKTQLDAKVAALVAIEGEVNQFLVKSDDLNSNEIRLIVQSNRYTDKIRKLKLIATDKAVSNAQRLEINEISEIQSKLDDTTSHLNTIKQQHSETKKNLDEKLTSFLTKFDEFDSNSKTLNEIRKDLQIKSVVIDKKNNEFSSPEHKKYTKKSALLEYFVGIIIFTLLSLIQFMVSQSDFGKKIDWASYYLAQSVILPSENKVQVIGIDDIKFNQGHKNEGLVDREQLIGLFRYLATTYNPRAIVVDLDLSGRPEYDHNLTKILRIIDRSNQNDAQNYNIFDWDKKNVNMCPIFFAFSEKVIDAPEMDFFGSNEDARFGGLATFMTEYDTVMPFFVYRHDGKSVLSLPAKVSTYLHPKLYKDYNSKNIFYETLKNTETWNGNKAKSFAVDYSFIDSLIANRISAFAHIGVYSKLDPNRFLSKKKSLQNKVFVLGMSAVNSNKESSYPIPGRYIATIQQCPTVFHYACAIETMLGKPVKLLTFWGNLTLDIFLGLSAASIVFLCKLVFIKNQLNETNVKPLSSLLLLVLLVLVWFFFNNLRIIWTGYIMLVTFALIEPLFVHVISVIKDFNKFKLK